MNYFLKWHLRIYSIFNSTVIPRVTSSSCSISVRKQHDAMRRCAHQSLIPQSIGSNLNIWSNFLTKYKKNSDVGLFLSRGITAYLFGGKLVVDYHPRCSWTEVNNHSEVFDYRGKLSGVFFAHQKLILEHKCKRFF